MRSTSGPLEDAALQIPPPSYYDPDTSTNVTSFGLSRANPSNFDSDVSVKIEGGGGIPMLNIPADLLGTNQWWILGWQSNSHHESVRHEFTGPCNGTCPVRGIPVTGEGVY